MDAQHSPGPWTDDAREHDAPYQHLNIMAGQHHVCTIYFDDAPVEDYNREQRANARIIKTAPDMLEALELWIEGLEHPNCSEAFKILGNANKLARVALKKAKGLA